MVRKFNVRTLFRDGIRYEEPRREEPVCIPEWDVQRTQHSIDSSEVLLTQWDRVSYGSPGR